jgi:putative transposase
MARVFRCCLWRSSNSRQPQLYQSKLFKLWQTVVKTPSTRTHKCPHCGYVADRDENAAINILKSALKQWSTTVGRTECEV